MIRRPLAALLALAGFATAARADFATLMVVESVNPDRNEIVIEATVIKQVPVQKQVVVNVNGKLEERIVTTVEIVSQKVKQTVSIANSTVYTGAGNKLDTAEAMKRLKPGSVVVMGPISLADKKYAGVFRPRTLLLLSNGPGPGSGTVVPVPSGPKIKLPAPPVPAPVPVPVPKT